MKETISWILFAYKLPTDTSTLRVRVWRTLKSMGVLYIQQSVCVAPALPEVQKKLQQIQLLIHEQRGELLTLEVAGFSQYSTEQLTEMFNAQRKAEYGEFLEGCRLFLKEIETETNKGKFTFHEVEENEADLAKLKRWYRKILKRDFFKCPVASEANTSLETCEQALKEFSTKVYQTEGNIEGNID